MTVILLRHGRSVANARAQLAGRSPGIGLDETGRAQAAALADRLRPVAGRIAGVVRSPLQRCEETVAPLLEALAAAQPPIPEIVDDDLIEVDYGDWTNQPIKTLLTQPLWKTVQRHPSGAVFPGGEGLADVQNRAVAAVRRLDQRLAGPDGHGLWVACTHGDVIKSVVADALGLHLDQFQRIIVDPASISVIRYGPTGPVVHTVNSSATLSLPQPPAAGAHDGHADDAVGGSTGAGPALDGVAGGTALTAAREA